MNETVCTSGRIDPRLDEGLAQPPSREQLRRLARRLRRAAARLGVPARVSATLGVRIVGDDEMARLHREFMGEDGPTDVLSFTALPLAEELEEIDAREAEASQALGDIVLDWDAVRRQATGCDGDARLDEATRLAVHALAHLLGHDHGDAREGRRMHRVELRALRAIRVADAPRPYVRGGRG